MNAEDVRPYEKDHINKNREGFYGWIGFGGSVVEWHPELKIGFAFIPTFLNALEVVNERGAVLQQIVKDCCIKSNRPRPGRGVVV